MRIKSNSKIADRSIRDESSERVFLDNRMEESEIFLIWEGRQFMVNSALEGLRQSRLDDIH